VIDIDRVPDDPRCGGIQSVPARADPPLHGDSQSRFCDLASPTQHPNGKRTVNSHGKAPAAARGGTYSGGVEDRFVRCDAPES
jgi:hypothetical protein